MDQDEEYIKKRLACEPQEYQLVKVLKFWIHLPPYLDSDCPGSYHLYEYKWSDLDQSWKLHNHFHLCDVRHVQ